MKNNDKNKSKIIEKMNDLVESIISFNSNLEVDPNSSLKYFLNNVAQTMPNYVEAMIKSKNLLIKRKSLLETRSSLDETKVYLSLIEGFGYAKTKELSNKVEEFNKLLTKNFS